MKAVEGGRGLISCWCELEQGHLIKNKTKQTYNPDGFSESAGSFPWVPSANVTEVHVD